MAVQVDSPEKRVSVGRGWVWEADKVNCDVTHNPFGVQYLPNRRANSLHVHVRQRLLREEATCIDVLLG